ncbi:MAG: class I SAM-dependent methyltransferase [Solirubrobacterales bacterium]
MKGRGRSTRPNLSVVWHDVECGAYAADLGLWEELAEAASGPILELGCGTGRVGLHLARRGHQVVGVDVDPELAVVAAARGLGLPFLSVRADARALGLNRDFALILAPMQVVQLLHGAPERRRLLGQVRRHLRTGALAALAIVEHVPESEPGPPPLPDVREADGWVYSSLPLDSIATADSIVVSRLRQTVSPEGTLSEEQDVILIDPLSADGLEREAIAAGLSPAGRRHIPPTDAHIGSTVVLVKRAA